MARPRYTKEQVVSWISRFKYGNVDDPQYQKQIIDTFINSIYVFDDKLVFTYNFKDGTETITLAEIQAAFGSDLTQVAPPLKAPESLRIQALVFSLQLFLQLFLNKIINYPFIRYYLLRPPLRSITSTPAAPISANAMRQRAPVSPVLGVTSWGHGTLQVHLPQRTHFLQLQQ